jgi:hypothetical protein
VVGSALTAFAFTFPLFLAMRQRALNARASHASASDAPADSPPDGQG